jgi:hypothetical protein
MNGTFAHKCIGKREAPVKRTPAVEQLLMACAFRYGVTRDDLLHGGNRTLFVAARRDAARRLRGRGYSYPVIARYLGIHYTTALHLVRTEGRIPVPVGDNRDEIPCPDLSGEWAI